MHNIIIAASPQTEKIADTLVRLLVQDGHLIVATNTKIVQTDDAPGTAILTAGAQTAIEAPGAILLLPREAALPVLRAPLTLVADSARANWPVGFEGDFISCGHSAKDTLTLSSRTKDSAVVALVRQIRDLAGRLIEPCEFPVLFSGEDPFVAFAAVSVLLLTGRTALLGKIGMGSNNLQL